MSTYDGCMNIRPGWICGICIVWLTRAAWTEEKEPLFFPLCPHRTSHLVVAKDLQTFLYRVTPATLILILDGTVERLAFVWPDCPCTSLLGSSLSFGILRKQAPFFQDGDSACHHESQRWWWCGTDKKGVYLEGEGLKKESVFNFQQELHGPQIGSRGPRNLNSFSWVFLEEEFHSTLSCLPYLLFLPSVSSDSDSKWFQRLAALCCGIECPLKGQAASAHSASEGCMTDITSRMESF